ncbi:hypothetical protein JXC34_02895 [Candidatus Woesearchaeota archaeon]|nr:hypothetical protein [Candidatus Woesearchaeota archaeon]
MEDYEKFREEAARKIGFADHILTMTYPLVNDPKLLKVVMTNTYLAMENTVSMLLHYERLYKRIPPFHNNFEVMLRFLNPILERYGISTGYIGMLNEIKEISEKQKESDVEFVRRDKLVFASRDYDLSSLSISDIKTMLEKAKFFMKEIFGVIEKNERIDGKR